MMLAEEFGCPVVLSEQVPLGSAIASGPGQVFLHPLDANLIAHRGDPAAQLEGAMAHIVGRAHRELDHLEAAIVAEVERPAWLTAKLDELAARCGLELFEWQREVLGRWMGNGPARQGAR